MQLKAEGHPESFDTLDIAASEARGKGNSRSSGGPSPSEEERSRYSGAPSGGGGESVVGETVTLGKDDKRMADAMYGHAKHQDGRPLSERERYQLFTNTVMRRRMESERRARRKGR
jgi:hypothetical protein